MQTMLNPINQPLLSRRRSYLVPVIIIVIGLPIALYGILLFVGNVMYHDEKAPNDSTLLLSRVEAPDRSNAFIELRSIKTLQDQAGVDTSQLSPDLSDKKLDAMLNGQEWDEAYTAALVEKLSTSLQVFLAAAEKSSYQNPAFADPAKITVNSPIPELNPIRYTAKIAALDSLKKMKSGDVGGSLDESVKIVKLGHLMELGQGTLIEYLVGSAIKQIGLTNLRVIALNSTITSAQSKAISSQLEPYRDSRAGEVTAVKTEYAGFKSNLPQMLHLDTLYQQYNLTSDAEGNEIETRAPWLVTAFDYSGLAKFYYMPNQTWRLAVDEAQRHLTSASADCSTYLSEGQVVPLIEHSGLSLLFVPNAVGKTLIDIGRISFGPLTIKRCNESLAVSATQAALGVSAYTKQTGHLPDSLSSLSPDYVATVPVDPYVNQPLKYVPDKKIVYSFGPDRHDNGGDPVSADWQYLSNPSFAVSK